MGLIRLFLYEQPLSFSRFAVETVTLAALIGSVTGLVIANTLILLR